MSDWHYCRTTGSEGGVDAVEGQPYGLDLESILKDGLPPFKIALEVIAAICEILDIAEQDDEGHGDIVPRDVFIDELGAVSVEGFGIDRDQTYAPEGRPGYATDLWGLGYIAFRLFSPSDLGDLPEDPDEYDDAIIDAVLAINFDELPEEIVGDVQWFVAKLLSWEPDDRPPAIDVWRTFIAFADSVDGPFIGDWGTAALDGGGLRRDADGALRDPSKLEAPPEELGGPITSQGPLARGGGVDFSGGKKGQATAFWSRDAMKAALAAEPDEEEVSRDPHQGENQPYRPQVGGGSSTSFWSLDQMKAMAEGGDAAPRPKRRGKAGERSSRDAPAAAAPPPPSAPVAAPAAPVAEVATASPAVAGGPVAGVPIAGGPLAGVPMTAPMPVPEDDGGGGKTGLIAGSVVLLMSMLCLGGAIAGGGIWYVTSAGEESAAVPAPKPAPAPKQDTGTVEPTPEPEPAPAPKPAAGPKPLPSPKPAPAPSPTPKPRPAPRPSPAPAPAPAPAAPVPMAGVAKVTFRTPGRAFMSCSDGQKQEVNGSLSVEFDGYQLPVSCRLIDDNDAMWAGLIARSGTVMCSLSDDKKKLNCVTP